MSTPISHRLRIRERCPRFAVALLIALAALVLAPPAAAQTGAAGSVDPASAGQAGSPFDSPREALRAFLDYRAGDRSQASFDEALAAFDTRGAGSIELQRIRDLVRIRLVKIFDRLEGVDLARFDQQLETIGPDRAEWRTSPPGHDETEVRIGFARLPNGGWVIDSETLERVADLYDEIVHLPRVGANASHPMSGAEWVRSIVPGKLQGGGFLLEPYQWIALLLLFLIAFLAERVIAMILRPLIRRLAHFHGATPDPRLLQGFERPFGWILLVLMFAFGMRVLDLPEGVAIALQVGASLFTTFCAVWACYRLVDLVCWPLQIKAERTDSRFDDMLVPLLRRTLKVLVVIVGSVFLVSRLTGDVWHVLAGLSIGSLAIGFAAKDSIENLFGTFTVLLDSPFKIGDVVKFADFEGTVEEVGFRSTRIRTPEDSLVTVPNSKFVGSHVDNLGARRSRRVKLMLGLVYDTPAESIEAFCEGLRELIRAHPLTAKHEYHVWLANFSASSLDVELICYLRALDYATYTRERHRLLLDVLRLAQRLKIAFAFPTQTVWAGERDEEAIQDAPRTSSEAIARGRASARELTEVTLAPFKAAPPPPVRFEQGNPDAIGR